MRVDVIMPQMGESIQEGTLVKWLKKVGDSVGRDEPLFEISTDKVDAEIPAPAGGIVAEIRTKEGETVVIKTVVAVIETEAGKTASAEPAGGSGRAAPAPHPVPAPTSARPAPGPSSAAGERPAAPAPAGVGPRSTPVSVPGAGGGGLASTGYVGGGPTPAVGVGGAPPRSPAGGGVATLEERLRTRSSPVVRKIAAEHGIEIAALTGSGVSGRVTKADILGYIESGAAARAAAPAVGALPPAASAVSPYPAFAPGERFERVPMTAMRRKIAEHMVASKRISAHVTTWFEIDMSRVGKIRSARKDAFQDRHGVNLSFMPFIMKAAVDALMTYPALNASIDGTDILYKKDINLGIAVALDWGLIVPVVRNAQDLSLAGLAKAMNDLATRARAKQLKPDEVTGGTFTITNPGVFGSLMGTPIINQPQVAILGVGTIEKRPVVVEDAIAIRTMSYFGITFDHRLVDGALADQFMAHIKKTLQEFDEHLV